jgi:hypothetical protein
LNQAANAEKFFDFAVEPVADGGGERSPEVVANAIFSGSAQIAQPAHRVGGNILHQFGKGSQALQGRAGRFNRPLNGSPHRIDGGIPGAAE